MSVVVDRPASGPALIVSVAPAIARLSVGADSVTRPLNVRTDDEGGAEGFDGAVIDPGTIDVPLLHPATGTTSAAATTRSRDRSIPVTSTGDAASHGPGYRRATTAAPVQPRRVP
jgi:hypothetical protein